MQLNRVLRLAVLRVTPCDTYTNWHEFRCLAVMETWGASLPKCAGRRCNLQGILEFLLKLGSYYSQTHTLTLSLTLFTTLSLLLLDLIQTLIHSTMVASF